MSYPLFLALGLLGAADLQSTDLSGQVFNSSGQPVSQAKVFILTAYPRVGGVILCPPGCAAYQEQATTDASGKFEIRSLPPELLFQLTVAADGYQLKFVDHADPAKGPLEVRLVRQPPKVPADRTIGGRVISVDGKPIIGAVVSAYGHYTATGREWGRSPACVTNGHGEFLIVANAGDLAYDFEVLCLGYAQQNFRRVEVGRAGLEFHLAEGVTVRGRILKDGKAVPGMFVAISLTHRRGSYETLLRAMQIATDSDGQFVLRNVPPDNEYYVWTPMHGTTKFGSIPVQTIDVAGDCTVKDLGNLNLAPVFRLAGRIVLTDGQPLPPSARILLRHGEVGSDTQTMMLKPGGSFCFEGVPKGVVRLIVEQAVTEKGVTLITRLRGYQLATDRTPMQQSQPGEVVLFVDADKADLQIFFEREGAKPPIRASN
ncbi:MAG: carboxypeptidase-like regulatory domain-containing protein [Thermoguttaceae bacterium]|jgi:hypothetical protein